MKKVDHSLLKATPKIEDLSGKYEDTYFISLVEGYKGYSKNKQMM